MLTISQGTPNIGIAYIAGSIKAAGHKVFVVDALGESLDQFTPFNQSKMLINGLTAPELVKLIPGDSDLIGITCMFSNEWFYTKLIIEEIAQMFPEVLIVAGGEHVTADPFYSLRTAPDLDYLVLGEGEETIVELLSTIENGKDFRDISGLGFLNDTGEFEKTKTRERVREIDQLHWPSWDEIPIENYLDRGFGFNVLRGRPMPLMATRGCPYQCTFCSSPQMWTTRWLASNTKPDS